MNELKNIKLILIILIILSSIFPGCVQAPVSTPTPTPTPAPTETVTPTAVQTVPSPTPTPANDSVPVVYYADVDGDRGFSRIVSNSLKAAQYDVYNRTLIINAGDTIVWNNDADPEEKLTIVSEEGLWTPNNTRAILRWNRAKFNYTFAQPGTYGVYIKEFEKKIRHLKIIVNP